MLTGRRIVACLALLGVVWASLWPLVATAHADLASEPIPLCHGAGMMVGIDQPGQAPQQPGPPQPGLHCPLCVMAFYAAFHPAPEPPPFTFCTAFVTLAVHCAAMPFGLEVQLPASRAPPALRA